MSFDGSSHRQLDTGGVQGIGPPYRSALTNRCTAIHLCRVDHLARKGLSVALMREMAVQSPVSPPIYRTHTLGGAFANSFVDRTIGVYDQKNVARSVAILKRINYLYVG